MKVGEHGFGSVGVHMWCADCRGVADGLGAVLVRGRGGVVGAVDLGGASVSGVGYDHGVGGGGFVRTLSMAALTRGALISLFVARFSMRAVLVAP